MPDLITLPRTATAEQVAEALGLRLHRVYSLTREGRLPHVRIGRQVRYPIEAIRAWVDAGGTTGDDAA